MAPNVGDTQNGQYKPTLLNASDYNKEAEENGTESFPKAKYPHYLPTWDPEDLYPPLEPFEHYEHGQDADQSFSELLHAGTSRVDLTPLMGTEICGVQLSTLTDKGRDQLALLTAQRKVVVFRDQDFSDLPIPDALAFGRYFGRLNVHPTTGSPKGFAEVHLAHRGAGDKTMEKIFAARTTSITWHSDTTFERQPAGTTLMYMLETPCTGGDTIFANNVEAYKRLSNPFRQRLHGLRAVHSGIKLAQSSRQRGGIVRKEPIASIHPLVRTHPATGEKSLFVNPHYVSHIVGYKREESDSLLAFLFDHIATSLDLHVRVKWSERSVVVWDNRLTNHAATFDWITGERRHLARITPEAEQPYETPYEGDDI